MSSPVLDLKQHARLRACLGISAAEIILSLFSPENELLLLDHIVVKPGEKTAEVLEHLAARHDFFQTNYAQVYIGVSNPHYTLVPGALFESANKEQLLRFNHNLASNEVVLADEIASAESFCVYSVNKRIKELLDTAFPNNHIKHKVSCLLESLPALSSKTHKTCLVHVEADVMDIALYQNRLLFFNSFSFQAAEDFLYFILASLEQNNCPLESTEVILAGEIETGSALYNTLKKYIPKIKFAVADKSIVRKNELASLPDHFYFALYNLYLCAL